MNKALIGLLSLMLVAALTGCGGGAEPQEDGAKPMSQREREDATEAEGSGAVSVAPAAEEAPAEEAPAEVAAEAAAATVEVMEAQADAPAGVDGLVGSTWKYDEIDLTFKEDNKVFLKGGPLEAIAPDGTEATYTLGADGAFEVSVLGQTYGGTFDGTKLVVDGKDAVKQ